MPRRALWCSTFERSPAIRQELSIQAPWNGPCSIGSSLMEAITATQDGVLAIDDEPELLDIVKRSLEPAGFKVYTASTAKCGVEFYEKNWRDINVVLLDY